MNKVPKKVPKRILDLVERLEIVFDLCSWDGHIVLKSEDQDNRAASVDIDEDYQRIYIYIYPCFFNNPLNHQREYILHEFCHVITHRLVDQLDDFKAGRLVTPQQIKAESERATSRLTNILGGFLTGGYKNSRKAYAAYLDAPKRKKKPTVKK